MPVTRPIPNSGSSRLVPAGPQMARQTNRRLVALLPCHDPRNPVYFRDRSVLVPTAAKRCLNELEALKPQRIARGRARTRFDPLRRSTLSVRRSRRVLEAFEHVCKRTGRSSRRRPRSSNPPKKEPKAPKAKAANADKEKARLRTSRRLPAAAALRIRSNALALATGAAAYRWEDPTKAPV